MGSKYVSIWKIWEYTNFLNLLAIVFGFLSFFYGLFIVESTQFSSYNYYLLDFLAPVCCSDGPVCIIPFFLGLFLITLNYFFQLSRYIKETETISKIPKNLMLILGSFLAFISILLLFIIYPAGNPHTYFPNYDVEYFYHIDLGFIFQVLMIICIFISLIYNKFIMRHLYNKYLPNFNSTKSYASFKNNGEWVIEDLIDEILTNPTRKQILFLIQNYPGMHIRELCSFMNKKVGTIMAHLRILEATDYIRTKNFENFKPTLLFLKNYPDTYDLFFLIKKNINAYQLLQLLINNQFTITELSSHLDLHHSTIQYHLDKLERLNLIIRITEDQVTKFTFNKDYLNLFQEFLGFNSQKNL